MASFTESLEKKNQEPFHSSCTRMVRWPNMSRWLSLVMLSTLETKTVAANSAISRAK